MIISFIIDIRILGGVEVPSELSGFCEKKPALVVLGQSNFGRAVIVNELFHRHLLPMSPEDTSKKWRMIKMFNGPKDCFYLKHSIPSAHESPSCWELTSTTLSPEILYDDGASEAYVFKFSSF